MGQALHHMALEGWIAEAYPTAINQNAASATEEERHNLLRQRKGLLDKKLDGRITPSELNKLEYVRWSLDRIEDARYGSALDALEDSVSKYENFISEIHSLSSQLLPEALRASLAASDAIPSGLNEAMRHYAAKQAADEDDEMAMIIILAGM